MNMQARIEDKLTKSLTPERLQLDNESHKHRVAKGAETHFNLIIVAAAFEGMSRVQRQRRVYAILEEELRQEGGVHALTMKALTPGEWEAAGGEVTNPAPRCLGGSKHHG
ncbi:MAG: BolA family protein [Myxococcota bacterium]